MSNWQKTYEKWDTYKNLDKALRKDLDGIRDNTVALEEAFHQELTFGTGGVRGILGSGINRMNIYTVRKSIQGLANYLRSNHTNIEARGVVVAYDSRYMSEEFALEVAKVLGVHRIKTYIFDSLRPTPLLSFAVRHLGTIAGVMITASHNPSIYNGFKVYNEDGGQITLAEADTIITAVEKVENALTIPVMEESILEEKGLLEYLSDEVDNVYLEKLFKISKLDPDVRTKDKPLPIVFTPLHGTAESLVIKGLKQLNFSNVTVVKSQAIPDPEFSTVKSPNPEEAEAFSLAIEQGKEQGAAILLATDPDADRLGVAVKDGSGEYILLTGNQLGVLLLDYILAHTDKSILKNARMLKTIVTTELGRSIADAYGVQTVDTLTGFKFIAEKIREYDKTSEQFIFGFEESYGYLISEFSRDKDAVQAVVMTCEMAYYWEQQGKTLLDALNDLYNEHGFYLEGITSITLEGMEGSAKIAEIMAYIRNNPLTNIAGIAVESIEDYSISERKFIGLSESTEIIDLPKENVIKFRLENDSWVCLRPSGTEPKIKCYYGVQDISQERSTARLASLQQTMEQLIDTIIEVKHV